MKKILSLALALCLLFSLCGSSFAEDCAHEETVPHSYFTEFEFVYRDEQYHDLWGYETLCDRCVNCGALFNEQRVSDEKVCIVCVHEFTDGVCVCGYESSCPHIYTHEETYYSNAVYSDINDKTHTVKGNRSVSTRCDDCGANMGTVQDEETSTKVQEHTFYGGVCAYCDYVIECEHSNCDITGNSNSLLGYEYIDEENHLTLSYPTVWYLCHDCGTQWSEGDPDNIEERVMSHYFENGVCDCGAENSCSHENIQTSRSIDDARYTAVNALGHVAAGKAVTINYCRDCYESWETGSEKVVEMEEHYLDYLSEDDYYSENAMMRCIHCGYMMPNSFSEHFDGLYSSYAAADVLEDVKALVKELDLVDGGAYNNYIRYGYLPGDEATSMIRNFSIVRPAAAIYEVDNNLFALGAFAEWELENQYSFQLEGAYDEGCAPIGLDRLRSYFNGEWKSLRALDSAAGYTVESDGTFYAWVPVYYEGGPGTILDNDLYLFLYIVRPGMDNEYLEGRIHYAYEKGVRSESYIIADSEAVSAFLANVYDPANISHIESEASEDYYDLSEGCQSRLVKQLQTTLVELGYLTSSADGYYGPDTKEAVKACQKDMGFGVTGVADVEFLEVILSNAGETALLSGWLKAMGY